MEHFVPLRHTMSAASEIEDAFLQAGIASLPYLAFEQMGLYLELLMRWNTRLSLTSLRTKAQIIQRHLVECGFVAERLPRDVNNLMDYGSGAGLPGVVVAICRPEIKVTLAEAHSKKASFLREVERSLSLECEVYEGRVEAMASGRRFHAVTMRAVEKMDLAIPVGMHHVDRYLALLTTAALAAGYREAFKDMEWRDDLLLPNSDRSVFLLGCSTWNRLKAATS